MPKLLKLYHGSQTIVGRPEPGLGRPHRDFGPGFYCTRDPELAGEWACGSDTSGYINCYTIDMKGLMVLDLRKSEFGIMMWLSLLASNRTFMIRTELPRLAAEYLFSHYRVNTKTYDIIIGPRADDSYFTFASDFFGNTVSFGRLRSAIDIGKEGKQVVIVSEKAFSKLKYDGSEPADPESYFRSRCERDIRARTEYLGRGRREGIGTYDIMIEDLILGRVAPYDPRLQ